MREWNFGRVEEERRVLLREEMRRHNVQLADAAKDAGVIRSVDYAIFQNHGYMGLYGGLKQDDIHRIAKSARRCGKRSGNWAARCWKSCRWWKASRRSRRKSTNNIWRGPHELHGACRACAIDSPSRRGRIIGPFLKGRRSRQAGQGAGLISPHAVVRVHPAPPSFPPNQTLPPHRR